MSNNIITVNTASGQYEDVTNEMSQFQRGVLISVPQNCPNGLMVGGKYDGDTWLRRWCSATMQNGDDVDNMYYRTGEIFYKDNQYYVVYRPFKSSDNKTKCLHCGKECISISVSYSGYCPKCAVRHSGTEYHK